MILSQTKAEADLSWFFRDAPGALGLQSHHEAMEQALAIGAVGGGMATSSWNAIEQAHRRIYAVERWRRIRRRLDALPAVTQWVLFARFGYAFRTDGLEAVGSLAPLCCWLLDPRSPSEGRKQLVQWRTKGQHAEVRKVRDRAEGMLKQALRSYTAVGAS